MTRLCRSLAVATLLVVGLAAQTPQPAPSAQPAQPGQPAVAPRSPQGPRINFPAPSPAATLKQRVGLTDIEIVYSRPGAKGRQMLGGKEPYGKVWRTGANGATKIAFSTAVKFGGAEVPAGTYGLFSIPGETEWTVILSKNSTQWGAFTYDQKDDFVRVTTMPVKLAEPVETFTIDLNDLRDGSATLNLIWEKIRVPVKIEVDILGALLPQIDAAMAAEGGRKPYAQAAQFYLDQNLDLKKALGWTEAAITERANPTNVHLKAKLLAQMGDKAGAMAAARQSIELAGKADEGVKTEYTKLNEALIAGLK
jgi:hypothetical protein